MEHGARVYVAGNRGLVGSAIERRLRSAGGLSIITSDIGDFDLTDPRATCEFFDQMRPEYVFVAAAKVGGIHANDSLPADFIRINLQIQTNLIDTAYRYRVKKLLFIGSSCIYPKVTAQPVTEAQLLSGPLEPTNDAYAVAKIAGIVMCKSYNRQHGTNFIAAMPTNLYGPGDNFDLETSHVLPALIRKFHDGKTRGTPTVELWGTGSPRREFLFVDDLADALVFLMDNFDARPDREPEKMFVNVGVGEDIPIRELATLVKDIVGYRGTIHWDHTMPDGTPRKRLDISRIAALGWKPKCRLRDGIRRTYEWYLDSLTAPRERH